MTDRNRELVPDNWSLVRESALTNVVLSVVQDLVSPVHAPASLVGGVESGLCPTLRSQITLTFKV